MIDVLVVDDEKHVRNLLVRMISTAYECNPVEAENVETALKLCDRYKFDLITTDIKFENDENLDGIEFIKRLRLRGIFTPVLIISAFATPENIAEVCKYAPVDYLAKP
ncbi:histidine kinase, partial [Fervidobacterium sp. SC_NGM5_O18]